MELTDNGTAPAASVLFDSVARRILARFAHNIPDMRDAVVLLPNYHVAQQFVRALSAAAGLPVILPPHMVTLNDWAQSIPLDVTVTANSQRSALLYQQLRKRPWFGQAELWSMAQELLALFDELTHMLTNLPRDADAFAAAVQHAYQARHNTALQLEARLVFELWHAMQSGDELDVARAYQRRLAILASQARLPLFVLSTSDRNALEQHFLDQYAQRAAVTVFDLRDMAPQWSGLLRNRPAGLSAQNVPYLGDRLHFFAAISLEQEARAAAMQVRRWIAAGKHKIAVVAQDRVVARRMRALLERAAILVTDESGWTFDTLSVSTVLDRWLDALQSDFYHHDLLDLLKSPFIFADMAAVGRKSAVYRMEQLLRKRGVVSGLEAFIALAEHETALHQVLERLLRAARLLEQGRRKTLTEWLKALRACLRVLGIDSGLQQDGAGQQLLYALEGWQEELSADEGRYQFSEWRRWLAQQLGTQTYRDRSIDSTVCFTHLAATRWRVFDAVLLLGCDADHLPGTTDGGRWFNDAARAALGLTTRSMHAARQFDDLLALLALNGCVLVTWQKDRKGEEGLLSPCLQLLRDLHTMSYDDDLGEDELLICLAAEETYSARLPQAVRPAPHVRVEAVPTSISISAYNSLVACPYQFYARHILHLNELDEVEEAIEKRDYGERVHDILRRFHERYPQTSDHSPEELDTALRRISMEVFDDLLQQDFAAHAWLMRWFSALPAYLEWQTGHEVRGWHYSMAESAFTRELQGVRLHGRIDRQDLKAGEKLVLDYKMQNEQLLRNKLKEPGEDVQLACYAYAHEAADAAFVSIENAKVRLVAPPHEVEQLALLNIERLIRIMAEMRGGAGLPANGIDAVCVYCEMRGLCRKGEWA